MRCVECVDLIMRIGGSSCIGLSSFNNAVPVIATVLPCDYLSYILITHYSNHERFRSPVNVRVEPEEIQLMSLRLKPSQTTRTSQSHPITQDTVIELDQGGRLGLCFCPGKKVTRDGITHNRDLGADLQHLSSTWRVDTVVCLLNAAELRVRGGLHYKHYVL